ncbi:MAG: hypothetical protein HUJ25_06890 [Crocinitomicaceae bacterium]|nr:hypothetical protein [Crocinitomicaceae bacterium]
MDRVTSKRILLADLTPEEVKDLEQDLYRLFDRIFGNVSFETFQHYVTHSGAEKTTIMLYKNTADETVGFFAFHVFHKVIRGKKMIIFRGQLGLLEAYRRKKANMYFGLFQVLRYRLMYPFRPLYCILTIISPSMYAVLAKNLLRIIPRYNRTASTQQMALIKEIGEEWDFEESEEEHPWATPVGWISVSSEKEREYWRTTKNLHVRYYQKLNPNFASGVGLITLVPFSWANIFLSSFKVLYYIIKKKIK